MSNKISISLHSDSLTIEALQELLQKEFAEDDDLQFSLKTEKGADTRGADLLQHFIDIGSIGKIIWDMVEDVVKDAIKERMKKVGERVVAFVKKELKERYPDKKFRLIFKTKKKKISKQLANDDAPIKIQQDDEIESIQIQEVK